MLTTGKISLIVLVILFQEEAYSVKYLEGKCRSQHYQKMLLQIFSKITLTSLVIVKIIKDLDDFSSKNF